MVQFDQLLFVCIARYCLNVKRDTIKVRFILCSPKRETRLLCIIQELKTYKQRLVTTIEAKKRTSFADHSPMDDGVLRSMLGGNYSNVDRRTCIG